MAVDSLVTIAASDGWKQLTNADATTITVIHRGGGQVLIRATVGAVAPAPDDRGGRPIETGSDGHPSGFQQKPLTELSDTLLVTRVYGRVLSLSAVVYVETD